MQSPFRDRTAGRALDAGSCEATIPAQNPFGSVVTTTNGIHVSLAAAVTTVIYTVTKDGFLCPFSGTGAKTGATYSQHSPVTVIPIGGGSISVD